MSLHSALEHEHEHGEVDRGTPFDQSLGELDFLRSACALAQRGQVEKLRSLLCRRPECLNDDGEGGRTGLTPLHYASRAGQLECVRLLLSLGCDVERRTVEGGATSLHRAAYCGHADVLQTLLAHGCDAALQDADGETSLHKASRQGHFHATQMLLAAFPQAQALTDRHGLTARDVAQGDATRCFEALNE